MWPRTTIHIALLSAVIGTALRADSSEPVADTSEFEEFRFVRLAYSGGEFGARSWLTDWPDAEQHLLGGVRRLTRIKTADDGIRMGIMDDKLFDYPWIYAVEVGQWHLDEDEAARLRDYLLRGGFLMVDDFHGTYEWESFLASMRRVFPDRPIVDIPQTHSVFHVVYDLNDRVQIPGIGANMRGVTYERDGYSPQWRGIFDDAGRLIVAINFNMDLGDAWEHADTPEYPVTYTTRAYQYAINYILYAMTH